MGYGDPEQQDVHTWLRAASTVEARDGQRAPHEWAARRLRITWKLEDARDEADRARRIARWAPPTALALAVACAAAWIVVLAIPAADRTNGDGMWMALGGLVLGFGAIAAGIRAVLSLMDQNGARRDLRRWERTLAEHDDAHTDLLLDGPGSAAPYVPGPIGRLFLPRETYDAAVAMAAAGGDPTADPDHDPAPDLAELGLDDPERKPR